MPAASLKVLLPHAERAIRPARAPYRVVLGDQGPCPPLRSPHVAILLPTTCYAANHPHDAPELGNPRRKPDSVLRRVCLRHKRLPCGRSPRANLRPRPSRPSLGASHSPLRLRHTEERRISLIRG